MSLSASGKEDWVDTDRDFASSKGSADLQEELVWILVKAVQELGSLPKKSKLDSWFLAASHHPGARTSMPFFLDVHKQVVKTWSVPQSARFHSDTPARLYTFPPVKIQPLMLNKIREAGSSVILVAPNWQPALVSGPEGAADGSSLADSNQRGSVVSGEWHDMATQPGALEPPCLDASGVTSDLDALHACALNTQVVIRPQKESDHRLVSYIMPRSGGLCCVGHFFIPAAQAGQWRSAIHFESLCGRYRCFSFPIGGSVGW